MQVSVLLAIFISLIEQPLIFLLICYRLGLLQPREPRLEIVEFGNHLLGRELLIVGSLCRRAMLYGATFHNHVRGLLARVHQAGLAFSPIVGGQRDSEHLLQLILFVAPDSNVLQICPACVLIIVPVILHVLDLPKLV